MTPKDVFLRVRMHRAVKDTAMAKFSDYELMVCLNTVLDTVYNTLSTMSNGLLTREIDVPLTEGEGELPPDFRAALLVLGANGRTLSPLSKTEQMTAYGYRIEGGRLMAQGDKVTLRYQPAFVPLTLARLTEELALPGYFLEMLAGYVVALLVGDETSLQVAQALAEDVRRLTAGRGYSYVEPQPVWKV